MLYILHQKRNLFLPIIILKRKLVDRKKKFPVRNIFEVSLQKVTSYEVFGRGGGCWCL